MASQDDDMEHTPEVHSLPTRAASSRLLPATGACAACCHRTGCRQHLFDQHLLPVSIEQKEWLNDARTCSNCCAELTAVADASSTA